MRNDPQSDALKEPPHGGPSFFSQMSLFAILFFLTITAYYQVKPVSRTLAITVLGSESLPYLWIGSALTLMLLLPFFSWRAKTKRPLEIVRGSCFIFCALFLVLYLILSSPTPTSTVIFYILVDIFGVVLIEEFWSLTSSWYRKSSKKPLYGIVGSGALLGGMLGSGIASSLLAQQIIPIESVDLIFIAAMILLLLLVTLFSINQFDWIRELEMKPDEDSKEEGHKPLNNQTRIYLICILSLVLLTQVIGPLIEYQFMTTLEQSIKSLDARTLYLSTFFLWVSLVGLAINLFITPLIHRMFGAVAGVTIQPLMIIITSIYYMTSGTLFSVASLKLFDRSISYSIHRASKELLYLPLTPFQIFSAKSKIDMFGYRAFKVIASFGIIAATEWYADSLAITDFSWAVLILCAIWILIIPSLRKRHKEL